MRLRGIRFFGGVVDGGSRRCGSATGTGMDGTGVPVSRVDVSASRGGVNCTGGRKSVLCVDRSDSGGSFRTGGAI